MGTGTGDDEAGLVARVVAGDEVAYRRLLEAHLTPVAHYARRMLGDAAEADDITQEVFLRLWTEAHRYRPRAARLTTWLHRIAHNLCIDYLRGQRRRGRREETVPSSLTAGGPEEAFDAELRARRARDAIAALPERQRSALLLCHYQGLRNSDAAAVLGVSVDALESLLSRARRSLRTTMEDEHEP